MIPKILHFVWCGDKPKPVDVLRCIDSWKKYCPDWEIREWGNDTMEEIDNLYAREAFTRKKWAFVSDYIRLYALQKYGGIYLDTDVELTAPLDRFLKHDFFLGCENYEGNINVGTALFGAVPAHPIINGLLDLYNGIKFDLGNGIFDMTPNPQRFCTYFKQTFKTEGFHEGNKIIKLASDCVVYPWWYFCIPQKSKINFAVHHFNGSWLDTWKRKNIFKINLLFFSVILAKFKRQLPNQTAVQVESNEKKMASFRISDKRIFILIKAQRKN